MLMEFNAPLAFSPQNAVIELKPGDVLIATMGHVYVEMPEDLKKNINDQNHEGNHAQALFREEFVELNPKIFKKL